LLKPAPTSLVGVYDIDACMDISGANSPVAPTAADRVQRVN
jgi:hypothetical protein